MVTRQQLIEYMQHEAYRPLTAQELASAFGMESGEDFHVLMKLLNDMEERGDVVRTRTNRYGVPERMNLVVGRLQMKARGYGFVVPETPGEPDVYIPAGELGGAMSGDKVIARVEKTASGARREGRIIRVLERATDRVVGKFTRHRDHAFVTPLDRRFPQDIFIAKDDMGDAHDGYVVVVEITEYPTATRGPAGRVVEVLGHPDEPGVDILGVVRKYKLPEAFPPEVLAAAEAIPLELSAKDYAGRRDLRQEVIVTIDGEDAKDLDDAVHVKRLPNGHYLLGVHIADVGYYVPQGSALDREAFRRGTSVYLVDRVIPMLPPRLSNIICSLNPQVDRLTLSCEMEIDENGGIVRHDIFPSVIRTTERMTYENVRRILEDRDPDVMARYEALVPHFELMKELALILRAKRMRRGAIDFDFAEIKVIVDDLGRPVEIRPRRRTIAEQIIEEFMLAANETVAAHFHWLQVPFIYRIHEEPELDKMLELNEFVHNFGYHIKGLSGKVHPRALQEVLEKARGTREERMIATLMLRSMKHARYAPECVGHFGLAAEYYTHFTSPIRRYPDLVIHRIIREVLTKGIDEARREQLEAFVAEAAVQASEREKVAEEAEREVDQLKMVEYMQERIGEEFDGLISGVTQFGIFVQLENGIEGLIHISYLTDDYYTFLEKQVALVGERTRRVFRLGDPVRVRVIGANKEELTIDFDLVAHLREGTMTFGEQGPVVVYDEDLDPAARRKAEAERAQRARLSRRAKGKRGGRMIPVELPEFVVVDGREVALPVRRHKKRRRPAAVAEELAVPRRRRNARASAAAPARAGKARAGKRRGRR
ncbi:ribonuclease R [Alicyclobacillus cellulosilyticus]|uniref:Ribonuclease R n=1 Tax=Alicyclobacillus cellulosilyticus TaxID=1003997 RepID=A0A917K5A5_9BACL|nr:ribonuclease R [Alicyclobacillus cellulosilyticus]GGI99594.1 ribonuclease R [Alicyclobacillus cellulosilyticus]